MKQIHSIEEFNSILEEKSPAFLLKHSTTCPVSQAAYEEYESFTSANSSVPAYFLTVQDARPVSNHVAEEYHIKHESPQAILFSNKDVVWHASHWKITEDSLAKAVSENS
ncbi:bacillithiol system redox-active protein YtxJ [Bacillus infantis]|uniref:bacillithiol system redox-active protein YtxJ n=1 Tax=Bacillus infantis TaxID=324767 RepID=UPI003CF62EEF